MTENKEVFKPMAFVTPGDDIDLAESDEDGANNDTINKKQTNENENENHNKENNKKNKKNNNQWYREKNKALQQTREEKAAHSNFKQMIGDSIAATDALEEEMLNEMATPQ